MIKLSHMSSRSHSIRCPHHRGQCTVCAHGGAVSLCRQADHRHATGIATGHQPCIGTAGVGVLFVINMTMLAVGWVLLGRRFAITTIANTVLSPLFLAL